jgi:hypothetical protein
MGDADDPVAGDLEGDVACPVTLKSTAMVVEGETVEFNCDALLWP